MNIQCKACGIDNDAKANFCRSCGRKLRATCDCFVKKEPYNCGQDQCPGYRLFLMQMMRGKLIQILKNRVFVLESHNRTQ